MIVKFNNKFKKDAENDTIKRDVRCFLFYLKYCHFLTFLREKENVLRVQF